MKVSIIIRTYNEARHLPDLLTRIRSQVAPDIEREIVLIDSGSTDTTLDIARRFECRIENIRKEDFSFGRSLNVGCASSTADALVFVSGHCIPTDDNWLANIVKPLSDGRTAFVYGRQVGNESSQFSECRIFEKYFPTASQIPQEGFYCNNANSALLRSIWTQNPFDENLTGLEDMHLAKQLVSKGLAIGYVADAIVYHLHDESWGNIKNRFEREAIALRDIMPEVHLSLIDFLRYVASSILLDLGAALQSKRFLQVAPEVVMYRIAQYWGSYRGNHYHRQLSRQRKERYFYPR